MIVCSCKDATRYRTSTTPETRKRGAAPHPSAGGRGDGYSQDMRDLVIAVNNAGVSNLPSLINCVLCVYFRRLTQREPSFLQLCNITALTEDGIVIQLFNQCKSILMRESFSIGWIEDSECTE
eukprot:scaffold11485_cov152-Skeletonema_marinoi.AAC.15